MAVNWPAWIQAFAAGAIVVLTAWTLKVLRDYAADTKRIADLTRTSADAAKESADATPTNGWVPE